MITHFHRVLSVLTAFFVGIIAQSISFAVESEPGIEVVAKGLSYPWGLAFLPDGRMLVSERGGRLRIVNPRNGTVSGAMMGAPAVTAHGQGGLLGLTLDPDFAKNRTIYLCFSEQREGGTGTSVFRAALSANFTTLENGSIIFQQTPIGNTTRHFGCRLVFDKQGNLFITLGDRGNQAENAQKLNGHIGKVIRIRPDGSIPADNPFLNRADAKPEIWSYGHRNIQGAALHPQTGELYTVEHGARGGDELNQPQAGKNYGWPVITYGIDYSGAKIGIGTAKEGMEQPLYYWDPSIAPSGLAFYEGDKFPTWRGSLLVGALAGGILTRLELKDGKITGETRYLQSLGERIRDVVIGPDGYPYMLTDSASGQVLRLVPAK